MSISVPLAFSASTAALISVGLVVTPSNIPAACAFFISSNLLVSIKILILVSPFYRVNVINY